MKTQQNDFSVLKEEISQSNVLTMAEFIAIMEVRFQIGYMGSRMQRMYADLYADIKHKHELGHTFSDSYDLVQEGALFLCEHYGKHLSDVLFYGKKGKPITIEIACIRKMMKLINRKTSDYYRSVSLEALTPVSEPSYEIKEQLSLTTESPPETPKERFEKAYKESQSLPKRERKAHIKDALAADFPNKDELNAFVAKQCERMKTNAIKRRSRLMRKLNLQTWDYFVTFTECR